MASIEPNQLQDPPETSHVAEAVAAPTTSRRDALVTWGLVAAAAVIGFGYPQSHLGSFIANVARFALVLGILVFVHEWGHFQFARWAGMKVNRFAIGFPPWIYTVRRKEINYSIGALPVGGMVDIAGLGSEEEMVATARGAEAAVPQRRPLAPRGSREFQETSLGWRFFTLFAGPLMNFIYALVISVGLYSIVGIPHTVTVTNQIQAVSPGMPADKAGLLADDKVVGVNGIRTTDQMKQTRLIRGDTHDPLMIEVERKGKILNLAVHPLREEAPTLDGKGTEKVATVGITFLAEMSDYRRVSVFTAAKMSTIGAVAYSRDLLGFVGKALTGQLSSREKRGVSGPVGIAQAVSASARQGFYSFLEFTVMLSINLGILNLLPVPALDGGRILFLGYELVARRPLDARKEGYVHMVGMVIVLAFMLFITVRDVLPYLAKGLHHIVSG